MAISSGADLVLELPYPYSSASASYFAGAGVAILDALAIDQLSFGSECADLSLIEKAAAVTQTADFHAAVSARQRAGEGSAHAYFEEMKKHLSDTACHLLSNDILAVEYVRAVRALNSEMVPLPLKRNGSAYTAENIEDGKYPSATALRRQLSAWDIHGSLRFCPESSAEYLKKAIESGFSPVKTECLDAAILSFFRLHTPEELSDIAEMQGGLAHRLCHAAHESVSFSEMLTRASSKSYPLARLRRAVLFAMTGVKAEDLTCPPAYLSLLGATERGRQLLRDWKESSPIPIFAKFADAASLSTAAGRQAELTVALDSLFTLAQPKPAAADHWIKMPPVLL